MANCGTLDGDGNSFSPSNAVLDSDGNSFAVSNIALDSDGNSFTICASAADVTGTGDLTTGITTLAGSGIVLGTITGTGDLATGKVSVSGYDALPLPVQRPSGGGTSSVVVSRPSRRTKQKLILVERVEDVEELLEQIDEIVEQSPKTKVRAKVQKPTQTVQEAPQAAFDWLAYYDAQLSRLRDQQRANSLRLQLDRNAELIRAIIDGQQNAQQQAQMLQMQQDEEDLLLLLMAA